MSSLAWLAFSESERRQMLDALSGLGDRDTVDELGIGGVRDALSDAMFPGTSTIMTRARYFLLVAWTHQWLEGHMVSSAAAASKARDLEVRTIAGLCDGRAEPGVIGSQARETVLRLPSALYWQGLRTWSIRRFDGGQSAYFHSLDAFYRRSRDEVREYESDDAADTPYRNWDDELPIPEDFPRVSTLKLTRDEAEYLRRRYRIRNSDTLLGWLLENLRKPIPEDALYPWDLPAALAQMAAPTIPPHLMERVVHAELLSLATYGGILLYNLMLAEKTAGKDVADNELVLRYRDDIAGWISEMDETQPRLDAWWRDKDRFWETVETHALGSVWVRQQAFTEQLVDASIDKDRRANFAADGELRNLVRDREFELKRGLARLAGGRALDRWGGASGIGRHRFRWHRVRDIANDIIVGRK